MTAKAYGDDDQMDEREFRAEIRDVVSSQNTIAQSQARMEGSVEGIRQTLDTLIAAIGDVTQLRVELAKIQERDRHEDPQVAILRGAVATLQTEILNMKESERRHWVEGLARLVAAGGVGGGLTLFVHKVLT